MKYITILLMLAGSFFSCSKRSESGGDVPYRPCPCENESLATIKGETHLFINEINTDTEIGGSADFMRYVSYYDDVSDVFVDHAYFRLKGDYPQFPGPTQKMPALLHICNFPDFAKQWHIPDGRTIYYEGIVYPNCEEFTCRGTCYGLILTKLIVK